MAAILFTPARSPVRADHHDVMTLAIATFVKSLLYDAQRLGVSMIRTVNVARPAETTMPPPSQPARRPTHQTLNRQSFLVLAYHQKSRKSKSAIRNIRLGKVRPTSHRSRSLVQQLLSTVRYLLYTPIVFSLQFVCSSFSVSLFPDVHRYAIQDTELRPEELSVVAELAQHVPEWATGTHTDPVGQREWARAGSDINDVLNRVVDRIRLIHGLCAGLLATTTPKHTLILCQILRGTLEMAAAEPDAALAGYSDDLMRLAFSVHQGATRSLNHPAATATTPSQ